MSDSRRQSIALVTGAGSPTGIGFAIARALNEGQQPCLVHCSSGDRASAAFGCYLISFCGFSHKEALAFAQGLALQNAQFIAYLNAYPLPK